MCDDGLDDNMGCLTDCTGSIRGWSCLGGDYVNATVCKEICNDGILVGIETCDDGKGDTWGCKDTCVGV